jgi:putative MATE family efflux protein
MSDSHDTPERSERGRAVRRRFLRRQRDTPRFETLMGGAVTGVTCDGRLKTGRLAGLSMGQAIWVLSWPVLVESFLNSLVGLTDTVLVAASPLGRAATDAIGGAAYIMWFIGLVGMSLGIGATALVSRSMGAGRRAVANAALGQTLLLAAFGGVAVGLLVYGMAPAVARLMNLDGESGNLFVLYMSIVAAGVPLSTLLFAITACARGAGDAIRPLFAMIAVNIVNIVLSWVLSGADLTRAAPDGQVQMILENPFEYDLGVAGIALGTVAGHAVGAIIIIGMALSGTWGIRLLRRRLVPHWHTMRRLIRVGLPNLAETTGLWFGNLFIVLMVGQIGVSGFLGSHIIAIRVESFSFLPGFAMGAAAATLAGQYLGAGSPKLAMRAVLYCTLIGVVMMGTIGLLLVLFPRQITGLMSAQAQHLESVPTLLFICGLVQAPFAVAIVTRGALRGAGDVRMVMVLTWLTTYAIRLPLAYALSGVDIPLGDGHFIQNPFREEPSLTGLWIALCIELTIRGVLFGSRFLSGRWTSARV